MLSIAQIGAPSQTIASKATAPAMEEKHAVTKKDEKQTVSGSSKPAPSEANPSEALVCVPVMMNVPVTATTWSVPGTVLSHVATPVSSSAMSSDALIQSNDNSRDSVSATQAAIAPGRGDDDGIQVAKVTAVSSQGALVVASGKVTDDTLTQPTIVMPAQPIDGKSSTQGDQPTVTASAWAAPSVPAAVAQVLDPAGSALPPQLAEIMQFAPANVSSENAVSGVSATTAKARTNAAGHESDAGTANVTRSHVSGKDQSSQQATSMTSASAVAGNGPTQTFNGQGHNANNFAQQVEASKIVSAQPSADFAGSVAKAAPTPVAADAASSTAGAQLPPASLPDVASMPSISDARLIQSIHQSEMKLGMNSTEFGSISIRTSVTQSALSTEISVAHAELNSALLTHVPAMQEKLAASYGLQARVEITGGTSTSAQDSGTQSGANSGAQSGGNRQGSGERNGQGNNAPALIAQTPQITSSQLFPVAQDSRLDINI